MQGETKSGFKYEIDDRVLKDWRFVEAITEADKGKGVEQLVGARKMIHLMFGDDYDKFMEHIAEQNDGFVPAEAVMAEVKEIFENSTPKN